MNAITSKPKTKTYYSVQQVADRWGTCERTVRRQIKKGALVAHRIGGSVRIEDEDLTTYERIRRAS